MTDQGPLPTFTPSREMSAYPSYPRSSYPPPGYEGQPPSKTMSTWALVLGLVPFPFGNLVAIGLAIAVLSRGRDGRNHGKGQAITALVVAPLWLLVYVALLAQGLSEQADRNPAGAVTGRGDVSVESLEVGDCLPGTFAKAKVQTTVQVAPCSEPHSGEVFANFEMPDGPFPGLERVGRLAEGGCAKRVEQYVGEAHDLSTMKLFLYHPLKETWSLGRGVTCIIQTATPTTGSLKGTES